MNSVLLPIPATQAVWRRWTDRGFVEAWEPKGFAVPGFEGHRLFTAVEIDPAEGEYAFFAYDGQSGLRVAGPKRYRNVCEDAARRGLKTLGREAFESLVADALAARGGGS